MSDSVDILLADDSEVGRYVIATMLRRAGFSVREVADGIDALAEVKREPPDLAIFDVKMPGLNGIEACRQLKADPNTSFVPVLMLSATFLDAEDRVEGLETGADSYLTQPVEPPVLIASIRSLLRARVAERRERLVATEWRVTFDAISDAVVLIDSDGVVRRYNRAFGALSGLTLEEGIDRCLGHLLPQLAEIPLKPHVNEHRVEINERILDLRFDEIPEVESTGGFVLSLRDVTAEVALAEERERVFHRERQVSTTLQQALALGVLPRIAGLELQAKYALGESDVTVGGDWFDAIQTERGVWLVIGDVAGHGVAAAAQAVQLRFSLQLLAAEGYGPAEAMSRLSELLVAGGLVQTASAVIAAIDSSSTVVEMVCGGHPPPILIDAGGHSRAISEAHGPLLGYGGAQHQAFPIEIRENETLVLYTDGLVERRGELIDLGIERLQEAVTGVSSTDLLEHAFAELLPEPPQDDVTMLIAHRVTSGAPAGISTSVQTTVPPNAAQWPN